MSQLTDSLAALESMPGVADATQSAREACAQLRWHPALRRRTAEAAAESRVRGARASAALDGAVVELGVVRDLMRGAIAWPVDPDPVEAVLRGAVQASAEAEHVQTLVAAAPAQALARIHVAAGAPLLPADQVGRPRRAGETCVEFADAGPAPDADLVTQRLKGITELILAMTSAPAVIIAALVHAEIATARPFVRGNGLVARAMDRAIIAASGLDPTGVVVAEAGHGGEGGAAYLGALAAYASGSTAGVRLWLEHCGQAIVVGAREGTRVADAVLAGRLS